MSAHESRRKPAVNVREQAVPVLVTEEVDAVIRALEALLERLGAHGRVLAPAESRRLLTMKRGGERHVLPIAQALDRVGHTGPGASPADMQAHLDLLDGLQLLHARLAGATEAVGDAIQVTRSDAWKATTASYVRLKRLARDRPHLATEIADTIRFFATPPAPRAPDAPSGEAPPSGTKSAG
jgi:hypothetical protein